MIGETLRQILSKLRKPRWTFHKQYKRIVIWRKMNGTHFRRQLCLLRKKVTKSRLRKWFRENKRLWMMTMIGVTLSQVTSKHSSLLLQLGYLRISNTWVALLRWLAAKNVIPCLLVGLDYLMERLNILRSLTVVALLNASNVTRKYRGS
jgi:hypothetical protein